MKSIKFNKYFVLCRCDVKKETTDPKWSPCAKPTSPNKT